MRELGTREPPNFASPRHHARSPVRVGPMWLLVRELALAYDRSILHFHSGVNWIFVFGIGRMEAWRAVERPLEPRREGGSMITRQGTEGFQRLRPRPHCEVIARAWPRGSYEKEGEVTFSRPDNG